MAAYDLVSFDGNLIGPGTSYDFGLSVHDQYVRTGTVETLARRGTYPVAGAVSIESRTLTVRGSNAGGVSAATFRANVQNWFDPNENVNGARYLVMVGDDGVTQIRLACYVVSLEYVSQGVDQYIVTLYAPNPIWEAVALTTSVTNPASVTNAGNVAVAPTITLTTTTHVTRYATTVTDTTGRGLLACPVVAALNDAAATDATTFVYINGVSVPTVVVAPGTTTSRVWFLVDVGALATTDVDIIVAAGLVNPLGGTLPLGGMDLAGSTNTSWAWNDWSLSDHPSRPGVWRLGQVGRHTASNFSYWVTTESATSIQFQASSGTTLANDADGAVLAVGAQAGTTTALAGLVRTVTGTSSVAFAFVRYRVANSGRWLEGWRVTAAATVSTSIDLDDAVEIVAGVEYFSATAGNLYLDLSGAATLALASTPTVTVGAASNYDRLNGVLTIGNDTITFDNLILPDGTTTIDCGAKSIASSVAGPQYGDDTPSFSDAGTWIQLEPGANAVANTTGATLTVSHRGGYA